MPVANCCTMAAGQNPWNPSHDECLETGGRKWSRRGIAHSSSGGAVSENTFILTVYPVVPLSSTIVLKSPINSRNALISLPIPFRLIRTQSWILSAA